MNSCLRAALALVLVPAWLAAEGRLWKDGDAPETVLVCFKPGVPSSKVAAEIHRLGGTPDLSVPSIGLQRLRVPGAGGAQLNDLIRSYRSSPLVEAAEPDYPVKAAAVALDDPLYTGGQQWSLDQVRWPQAVAAYNAGSFSLPGSVIVAVLDSGVDVYSELSITVQSGASFVAGSPSTDDLFGHGTFCAGQIAAYTGDGSGMAGAFFESGKIRILPVKVLDSCGRGFASSMVAGLNYASAQGAKVASLSLELADLSRPLELAVNDARMRGMLVVAAAGNDGNCTGAACAAVCEGGTTSFPARHASVLAVGALHSNGTRALYSNYGKLELSAPGGDGLSTCNCVPPGGCGTEIWSLAANTPANSCSSNSCTVNYPACASTTSYDGGAGTSFAAPVVAAAAALLFSQDPSRRPDDVQRILLQSAAPTAYGAGYDPRVGWGKLDMAAALAYQSTPPQGSALKAYNWPNPFNPERDRQTTFTFFLPGAQATKLRLLDAGGDLVRQWDLRAGETYPGMNFVGWDGHNGQGSSVASGAYTLVVETGGQWVAFTVAVLR